jgi:hypothetical protein
MAEALLRQNGKAIVFVQSARFEEPPHQLHAPMEPPLLGRG